MWIDVSCKMCEASYRISDSFAGRTAECRRCGHKFRIPYRSPIVKLDDATIAEIEAKESSAGPPFIDSRSKKEPDSDDIALIPLSAVLAEIWLPISLAVIFYGSSLYLAIDRILRSPRPGAGLLILGLASASIWLMVIPLTARVVESASLTFDFRLRNSFYLQTVGAVALPVFGATLGFRYFDITGLVIGLMIAASLCVVVMIVLYQLPGGKGFQSALLAVLAILITGGGTILATVIVTSFVLPNAELESPQQKQKEWTQSSFTVEPPSPASTVPMLSSPEIREASLVASPVETAANPVLPTTDAQLRGPATSNLVDQKPGDPSQPAARTTDLIALLDLNRDALRGTWTKRDGELHVTASSAAEVRFPYTTPPEYDFEMEFTPHRAHHSVTVRLCWSNGGRFSWRLSGPNDQKASGIEGWPSGLPKPEPPSFKIRPGVRCLCVIQVRRDSLSVSIDGREYVRTKTNVIGDSPDQLPVTICQWWNDVTFHKVMLKAVHEPERGSADHRQ